MGRQCESVEDTLRKVDQAMARLQEIQWTIRGGSISCGGVKLSPRSTRGYLRTSLRCKQESLRMKELELEDQHPCSHQGQHVERSSSLRRSSSNGEWRRWSMPAVLIQQAVGEIMEASNSAKEVAYLLSDSTENELIQFPRAARANLTEKPIDEMHEEKSSRPKVKNVLDESGRHDLKFGEKSGLQNIGSIQPENSVYKFKVIHKDASSNSKYNRNFEKEQNSAKLKAESAKLGMKVQRQMSFQASGQARGQRQLESLRSSLSVSHCPSPDKLINDKTYVKPLVNVEQIRPTFKAWMSHSSSTKAIMFPNSAFLSSPSNNSPKIERTSTSMRRKSLPPLKNLTSSGASHFSPSHKEKETKPCTTYSFPKLIKSSSFSDAYGSSVSKLRRQASVSSLLNKTLKRFHVIKASPSVASQTPSVHDAKAKSDTMPSLGKSNSLRIVSSSQLQGCSGRRHSMVTCNQSANCKASFLSKQAFQALVAVPKKRISGRRHPQPAAQGADVADKIHGNIKVEMRQEKTNTMPHKGKERKTSASVADDVGREEAFWIGDHSLQSNLPTMEKHPRNEMKCLESIQQCNNRHPSPNQRLLRPIAINCAITNSGQHETKMHASEVKQNNQKSKLQRKGNRENGTEDGGVNDRLMNSSRFLRKSWSFRCDSIRLNDDEKIVNGKGRSPSLKKIKNWMSFHRM